MRKLLRLTAVFLVLLSLVPSCELLEDCKSCTLIVVDNNGETTEKGSATYCGAELDSKEMESETINGTTSSYVCK